MPEPTLPNDDIGELLRAAAAQHEGHRKLALERAAHEAPRWAEEAEDLAREDRLTDLAHVGPWVGEQIAAWVADPPPAPEPDPTRRGYLTCAKVLRVLADADPAWLAEPHADLQVHSTDSDGALPIHEMAEEARRRGRAFIASTDHSQSLTVAHGQDEARLREKNARIDEINATYAAGGEPFRVLKAIEMDLFDHGEGDMADDALRELDLVLGAFHSKLRSTEDATERYLASIANPRVHVLAHPTARMYGRRPGLVADWPRVFAAAAAEGIAVEIDATPRRQDLNVELATIALEAGVRWFSIGSDAHDAEELEDLPIGMAIASLAGIGRDRVINYLSADEIIAWATDLRP
jgi:histidinol phosphatase-like PHP family hydrolase